MALNEPTDRELAINRAAANVSLFMFRKLDESPGSVSWTVEDIEKIIAKELDGQCFASGCKVRSAVKRFKVISGGMAEIVEAESHEEAAAKLFTMFDDCEPEDIPEHGVWISTIEVIGEELWHRADDALRRSGRLVESTAASTAEKPSAETQKSSG